MRHHKVLSFFEKTIDVESQLRGVFVIEHTTLLNDESKGNACEFYGYIIDKKDFNTAKLSFDKHIKDLKEGTVKIIGIPKKVSARLAHYTYDIFNGALYGKTYEMMKISEKSFVKINETEKTQEEYLKSDEEYFSLDKK